MAASPVTAIDITPDGALAADPATPLPGTGYRWIHWDLARAALPDAIGSRLPARIVQALQQAETRPRALQDEDGLLLVLRGINLNPGQQAEDMVSLRLWAAPQLVVTVRLRRIFALEEMRGRIEAGDIPATPGAFVARLVKALTDRIEATTEDIEARIEALEETLFDDVTDASAAELPALRRAVLRLRRFAPPQAAAIETAARAGVLPGPESAAALEEAANRARRATELLDAAHYRLMALADHLTASHAAMQGQNTYLLSVVAAIFLPLGFLTGLFGVNLAGMPGTTHPLAFTLLCLGLAGLTAVAVLLLRWWRLF